MTTTSDAVHAGANSPDSKEVAVLSIDIAGHTELLKKYALKARRVIAAYQQMVDASLSQYRAISAPWAGDGMFGAFFGPRRCEQAVLAGIQILHQIELMNLDRSASDLGEPLKIRLAALEGTILFQEPMSKMVEPLISETDKLQKKTRVQEFAIGDTIYRLLPENMRVAFEVVDRNFSGQQIYVYCGISRARPPESPEVTVLLQHVEATVSLVREQCNGSLRATVDAGFLSRLHGQVKECYEQFATFRRWCARLDPNWSTTYLRQLLNAAMTLQRLESALWSYLMDWRQEIRFTTDARHAYDLGFSSIAQDHGSEEMLLGDIRAWLSQALGEVLEREADDPSANLSAHLERIVCADEMERMAEFTALSRYDHNMVCEYLRARRNEEIGRQLVRTLWSLADLVVGEEMKGSVGEGPGTRGLFGVLLTDREYGGKFKVLEHFLAADFWEPAGIPRRFAKSNIDPTQGDLDTVWRAVVIAHPKPQIRYPAAEQAPWNVLWPAVAYHGISLLSLSVIATRLKQKESVDLKKIFFDCVRFRLERRIQDGDALDLRLVADMIEGFYESDLFVETHYFKALEALLALFESRIQRFGGQIESLEARLGEKIKVVRAMPKVPGSIPTGVQSLPPALQRHLAREGHYIEEFAFHPDDRIAVEVVQFMQGNTLLKVAEALVRQNNYGNEHEERVLNPKLLEKMSLERRAILLEVVEKLTEASGKKSHGSLALRQLVEQKLGRDFLRDQLDKKARTQ